MDGNAIDGADVLSAISDGNLIAGDADASMTNFAVGGDDILSATGSSNLLIGDAGGNVWSNTRGR